MGSCPAASIIGLVFAFLLARQATGLNQFILFLLMAGIAGAFIHDAAFLPASKSLQIATAPSGRS